MSVRNSFFTCRILLIQRGGAALAGNNPASAGKRRLERVAERVNWRWIDRLVLLGENHDMTRQASAENGEHIGVRVTREGPHTNIAVRIDLVDDSIFAGEIWVAFLEAGQRANNIAKAARIENGYQIEIAEVEHSILACEEFLRITFRKFVIKRTRTTRRGSWAGRPITRLCSDTHYRSQNCQ